MATEQEVFLLIHIFSEGMEKVQRLRVSAGKSQTGNNKIFKNMCS